MTTSSAKLHNGGGDGIYNHDQLQPRRVKALAGVRVRTADGESSGGGDDDDYSD